MVPGSGDLHPALHDDRNQDQQEIQELLRTHH